MIQAPKVEHINPFLKATIETYRAMCKIDIVPGKIALMRDSRERFDISGVIGLSGGAKGTVALSFPRITALKTVSALVGEKLVTLDDQVVDAVGELANIVAGAAKKDLTSYKINISLPTVVLGENHELWGPKDIIPIAVPFTGPCGNFVLIVRFKSEIQPQGEP